MKLYLDANCYRKLTDDLTVNKSFLEAVAIATILAEAPKRGWKILTSDVLEDSIANKAATIPQISFARFFKSIEKLHAAVNPHSGIADEYYQDFGIDHEHSKHMAAAYSTGADLFLTTDPELAVKARAALKEMISPPRVENPIIWLMEIYYSDTEKPISDPKPATPKIRRTSPNTITHRRLQALNAILEPLDTQLDKQ